MKVVSEDGTPIAVWRGGDGPPHLQGGDSSEPFKAAGEALRRALPDCRVAVMPGQRHAAMDTATDLFTAQVLSFLERPDRAL